MDDLVAVGAAFGLAGVFRDAVPLGSGHIHETYVVRYETPPGDVRSVLQRLNTRVFVDLDALMENAVRIAAHLRRKRAQRGDRQPNRAVPAPLEARAGGVLHTDPRGGVWRAYPFLEGTRSCDVVEGPQQAFEAARAFGAFLRDLGDLGDPALAETIPHFHDFPRRRAALAAAVAADVAGRAADVRADLLSLGACCDRVETLLLRAGAERLPRRPVHNDCKLNNLLLDAETGRAVCVVDLDTVMPGTALCDFGELVRTSTSAAVEDEPDLTRVGFELPLFEALARGYLAGAGDALSQAECAALPVAGPLLTLENAVRFLSDHLEGDVYFPARREGHNLDRCRSQLRRAEKMLEAQDEMGAILRSAARLA